MGQFATFHARRIAGFEELNEAVVGAPREVVQIERGKIHGELCHATISGLPIDIVTFDLGVKSRADSSKDRTTIAILTASTNRVTRSSYETRPGDVLVTLPGGEHDNRYYGGASILVISMSPADIEATFGIEGPLSDSTTWRSNHFKGNADTVQRVIPRLRSLVTRLRERNLSLTAEAAEFWKRAIIEATTARIVEGLPSERDGPLPSALRVVRQFEEYLDTQGTSPVHISQICSQLHVSRRTLHRAFHEAVGIGPIAFLRYRRLCSVHTALRSDPPAEGTIADLALQHGFLNVGRFAYYYRQLFGEYPSDTRLHKGSLASTRAELIA
jgi:AraC-like DNA-binding protein